MRSRLGRGFEQVQLRAISGTTVGTTASNNHEGRLHTRRGAAHARDPLHDGRGMHLFRGWGPQVAVPQQVFDPFEGHLPTEVPNEKVAGRWVHRLSF
eukprot:1731633-Pyramimonas_sp.AAC.1